MKRVKPYYRKEWTQKLDVYLKNWDYWKEGAIIELEQKMISHIGRKHAIAVNSATNAIFMCLYLWKQKYPNNNDVMLPNWGYPAAHRACKVLKLTSNVVDIDKWTLSMNSQIVTNNIGSNSLACVHIGNNGIVGDSKSIKETLYNDILFIEDCAPSILQATAGTHGDVSIFSFSPTKPFCAGEGAVILTDNDELADSLRKFRHNSDYNDISISSLNFSMSVLLATYLLPQFDIIDEIIQMREWVHAEYKKHIPIFEEPYIETNRHGAIMHLNERAEKISKKLSLYNIEHRYRYYPCIINDYINYPISCTVRDQIIDLPMHQDLTSKEIKFVCDIILRECR